MSRALTALITILMFISSTSALAAPNVVAKELEVIYGTWLSVDGTISEYIGIYGVSSVDCESTKYKYAYDKDLQYCEFYLVFKDKNIGKASTLKLMSIGNARYSFEFNALSIRQYQAAVKKAYPERKVRLTKVSLVLPRGSIVLKGQELAKKSSIHNSNKYDVYLWDAYIPLAEVEGTATLHSSVAAKLNPTINVASDSNIILKHVGFAILCASIIIFIVKDVKG